jgi:L-aspartate oxidase
VTTLADDGRPVDGEAAAVARLRRTMTDRVGVIRDHDKLSEALAVIADLEEECRSPRFRNALTAARMIAAAALLRTESRGGHYRSDFPDCDPAWRHRTFMTLAEAKHVAAGMATGKRVVTFPERL